MWLDLGVLEGVLGAGIGVLGTLGLLGIETGVVESPWGTLRRAQLECWS